MFSNLRFIKAEAFGTDCKITCHSRLFWFKPQTVSFVGSSTVWHSYPDGKRQPTDVEMWLCDRWQKWKWEAKPDDAATVIAQLAAALRRLNRHIGQMDNAADAQATFSDVSAALLAAEDFLA